MGEVGGGGGGANNISGYILQYYYISRRTADALSNEVVRAKYTYSSIVAELEPVKHFIFNYRYC